MLWKTRRRSLIIPAELHEKLARSCEPMEVVPSEVVRVRTVSGGRSKEKSEDSRMGLSALCSG